MDAVPQPAGAPRTAWRHPLLRRAALGLIGLVALLAGCATLDEQQRRWIFQPSDRTWSGGLAAAEGMADVWIDFDSERSGQPVRLHGLWLAAARPDAPVLLYLHGARYDVRGSAHRMRRMHDLGYSVLGIDYRGFGRSSAGLPSEQQAYEDARAAWRWLGTQHPGSRRLIFGHSLGAAIAVDLAASVDDEQGLMVEGGFVSMRELIKSFRWGWVPLGPLLTQRFDAGERIGAVGSPVLVVHGSEDRLIAPHLGRALYERAAEPRRFMLVEGGSHHSTHARAQPIYREAMSDLFGLDAVVATR